MNKEQIYDAEIAPLMTKILEICKREKIAMVAQFSTPNDDDPDLFCTSALLDVEYNPTKNQLAALSILKDGFVAFTRTRR
jgi:hypothetical protein